jgi:hypothetical protein
MPCQAVHIRMPATIQLVLSKQTDGTTCCRTPASIVCKPECSSAAILLRLHLVFDQCAEKVLVRLVHCHQHNPYGDVAQIS